MNAYNNLSEMQESVKPTKARHLQSGPGQKEKKHK